MPVCLNCGKQIESGRFCEECEAAGVEQTGRLRGEVKGGGYKPHRAHSRLALMGVVVLCVAMLGLFIMLMVSLPGGRQLDANLQAGVCRAHLRQIDNAIQQYYDVKKQYPPAGRMGAGYPIIYDTYINYVPRCPSTNHLYVIKDVNGKPVAACDSGLPGHVLK